ncbi:hypothetical protein LOY38_13060 [Pseudomonas sp. B21-015]|uniref:hypothetical protein n=1 Tax=Pseudomonas sp. B21-015 TaxID=2895473 RepID=UPI00215EEAA7|nr:hypothetical protein [Pseudomonas sp. B21-015]UVM52884.1 hypothetical protein LOY38_13060 [Pseudomonas sp. B21-015]
MPAPGRYASSAPSQTETAKSAASPCRNSQAMRRGGHPRYVVDRQRITDGISSGLDEALKIIALISSDVVAQKVQLTLQYNPCPPFTRGDPSVARPPVYTPGAGSTCEFSGMAETVTQVLKSKGCPP